MSEKKTYLFDVVYKGYKGIGEIDALSKLEAEGKMERLSKLGCAPASEFSYRGVKEVEGFNLPDFSTEKSNIKHYEKRKAKAGKL